MRRMTVFAKGSVLLLAVMVFALICSTQNIPASAEAEDETELMSFDVEPGEDTWSVPEVTVEDVPESLLEAVLKGNKALFTFLSEQSINFNFYSEYYSTRYGFAQSPVSIQGYDAYGIVKYNGDEEDQEAAMMFIFMPEDDEEYQDAWEDLSKYLKKQSSNVFTRKIAAHNGEQEGNTVYAAQEYMIDGKACYLFAGNRDNDLFFRFDRVGISQTTRAQNERYQGSCENCIVLMSRDGLSFLSDDSTVYDLERHVRYDESYQELTDIEEDGDWVVWTDGDYELDDYPGYSYSWSDFCYHAYDSLDYKMLNAESRKVLTAYTEALKEDTESLMILAGRYEQLDGYKDVYSRLLNIAAVLIRRQETDAASDIISYLEDRWKEEDKKERVAAFGDTEYDTLEHDESYLTYLENMLDDKKECDYLNTVWQVRTSAPYLFGAWGVGYNSDQYKAEYQPLIDRLTKLKGHKNAPLYLQRILKPFLKQTIAKRNTDDAEKIIGMMEEYFPDCGSYEITESELEYFHSQIDTIKEEEAYKAAKRKELSKAKQGDVISFGTRDEKDLEWLILTKQEDKVLLLLKNSFGKNAFGKQQDKIKYKKSEIRDMLESRIFPEVFSNAEKQMILPFSLKKDGSYSFSDRSGHFHLPGAKEMKEYLPEQGDRILYDDAGTPQAWWLRTAGERAGFVRYIDTDGSIAKGGTPSVKELEVRPLIWIDCSES